MRARVVAGGLAAAAVLALAGPAVATEGETGTDTGSGSADLGTFATIMGGLDVGPRSLEQALQYVFGDARDDHIFSIPGETAGGGVPSTDLSSVVSGTVVLGGDTDALFNAPDAFLRCGAQVDHAQVICPEPTSPVPAEPLHVYSLVLGGFLPEPTQTTDNPGDPIHQYAIVFESNGDPSDDWQPQGQYTWDGFLGTDRWHLLYYHPLSGNHEFQVFQLPQQTPVGGGSRVVLGRDTATFFIPDSELAAPTGWRGYTFGHDGTFQPETSGMDVTGGNPTEPLQPWPPTYTFVRGEEAEPSESPTSDSPTADATDGASEPTADVTDDGPVAVAGTSTGGRPWWALIPVGLLVGLGGLRMLRTLKGPCEEEIAAAEAADRACEEAKAEAKAARGKAEEAEAERKKIQAELDAVHEQLPGAGRRTGSSWVESGGRRITSEDVQAANAADAAAFDAWKNGEMSADEVMEQWSKRATPEETERLRELEAKAREIDGRLKDATKKATDADAAGDEAEAAAERACDAAAAAAAKLAECLKVAAAPPEPEPATGTGTTTAGPGVATTPGTDAGGTRTRTGPCKDGETRPSEVVAVFGPRDVVADFTLRVIPDEVHPADDDQMVLDLQWVRAHLGAGSAGLSAGGAAKSIYGGSLGEGIAGGAAGAASSAADVPIPTNAIELAPAVLDVTARLAELVATKTGQWTDDDVLYTISMTLFVQETTITVRRNWTCVAGQWRCTRSLDVERGKLRRWFNKQEDNVLPGEVRERSLGFASTMRSMMQQSLQRVVDFTEQYPPGPCE